ncbi:hypothetical protein BC829DRAFT_384185 [Chytridium lagenaria]|nr:hypothetical protein BC829DRAFT_384185 [Chytridium lagenaria]
MWDVKGAGWGFEVASPGVSVDRWTWRGESCFRMLFCDETGWQRWGGVGGDGVERRGRGLGKGLRRVDMRRRERRKVLWRMQRGGRIFLFVRDGGRVGRRRKDSGWQTWRELYVALSRKTWREGMCERREGVMMKGGLESAEGEDVGHNSRSKKNRGWRVGGGRFCEEERRRC